MLMTSLLKTRALRSLIAFVVVACGLLMSSNADASHFRYGNIVWNVPDPGGAPFQIEYTVTTGWRSDSLDGVTLNFGDASSVFLSTGSATNLGTGQDAAGENYTILEWKGLHDYGTDGSFTMSFTSCCRVSTLTNAADASFLVQSDVDLQVDGSNTSSPISGIPVIIQMEAGKTNVFDLPVVDPDGDLFSCRFSTSGESGIPTNPPVSGGNPVSFVPPGCSIQWSPDAADVGKKYALSIEVESVHNGGTSSATIDYIIELVGLGTQPTCNGGGAVNAYITPDLDFDRTVIGDDPNGDILVLNVQGAPAGTVITPGSGSSHDTSVDPFSVNLFLDGATAAIGVYPIQVLFQSQADGASGYCTIILTVQQDCTPTNGGVEICDGIDNDCDGDIDDGVTGIGDPCSTGLLGECDAGTTQCIGNEIQCSPTTPPVPETCDGKDNDCDGEDDNNPSDAGDPCTSTNPGICTPGTTSCVDGTVECTSDITPGTVDETCNGEDDDCDGTEDNNLVDVPLSCFSGEQGICAPGVTECNSGVLECPSNVDVGSVSETCDGVDEDCDGNIDNGFPIGEVCVVGLGICQATGTYVCDGNTLEEACTAVEGEPDAMETCGDDLDQDCDGNIDNEDPDCPDDDDDGLIDAIEEQIGTDPMDADSDDDGVLDGDEAEAFGAPGGDADGDGIINELDIDSDNDGLTDGVESGTDCSHADTASPPCIADADSDSTTDPYDNDTDDGGVNDGGEDANLDGAVDDGNETDPTSGNGDDDDSDENVDTDEDGLPDDLENFIGSDPLDADTDDDGVLDGDEQNFAFDTDGDGLINVLDVDSDNDGLGDGTETGSQCDHDDTDAGPPSHCTPDADAGDTQTSMLDPDTDDGGVSDGNEDNNLNGVQDIGETDPTTGNGADDSHPANDDSDGDGLTDLLEEFLGSDPYDKDSDDDGLLDGDEPNPADDADGDGLPNILDVDSDNDGLFDGTETGSECDDPDTDMAAGNCIPDADTSTTTNPLLWDTDGGGISDGSEDANLNGAIDGDETDPGDGDDDGDVTDTDGDGLSDDLEETLGSDPEDADTDDDGVLDGAEPNPASDTDGDGIINVLDVDSDNDALPDGLEVGNDCSHEDTEPGHCIADSDEGLTTTSALDRDSDNGGASDGSEDWNRNGLVDGDETDPTAGNGADDSNEINDDSDNDGLSDALEITLGSDPNDKDSDNDGLLDAFETNPGDDFDGDGDNNVADPDSDDDGLFDGTENGNGCDHPDTDVEEGNCVPDSDSGETTTNHLDPDTDDGGVSDGDEDENKNGRIDAGERDPNDQDDDGLECIDDHHCPDTQVCDDSVCVPGCRNDSECPDDEVCDVAEDAEYGQCEECISDAQCGVGQICDANACVPGCNVDGSGNGCEGDEVCAADGQCGPPPADTTEGFRVQGGTFFGTCGVASEGPARDNGLAWLLLASGIAAGGFARRRRSRK